MSKKERRKKNNRAKKVFNKDLLIKERHNALSEFEIENKLADLENKNEVNGKSMGKVVDISKDGLKSNKKNNSVSFSYKFFVRLRKWNNIFCTGMTCKTNLKRDFIIISWAIFILGIFLGINYYLSELDNELNNNKNEVLSAQYVMGDEISFEEKNVEDIATIQEKINIDNWKEYHSAWYGFKIKYPDYWKNPIVQPYSKNSRAIYRISFLSNNQENKNIIGFDVVIYDINKVKEFYQTDEFPKLKEVSLKEAERCKNIEGHLLETGDYPAEEIYISREDDCYNSVLFFTVVEGQYIYNIVPRLRGGVVMQNDPMVEISDTLPEFFVAVSNFENIDIIRPKPKPIPPKITAPKPASYKIVNGRLVFAKNKDKPSKSDKNKKKHLDMECCLDPDEYPNPHCYYDPGKYGKYLK